MVAPEAGQSQVGDSLHTQSEGLRAEARFRRHLEEWIIDSGLTAFPAFDFERDASDTRNTSD